MRQLFFKSLVILMLTTLWAPASQAIDLFGSDESYLNRHAMHLFFAPGVSQMVSDVGVSSDGLDMGWRFGVGYSFTRRLQLDFLYEFSSVPLTSPNPLTGSILNSKFFFISEITRLRYKFDTGFFDRWAAVPYVSLGLGLYHTASVNPQSGLDFPIGLQMPVGGGFESFIYKDKLSLSLDYTYHLLFDEEQNVGVLALLGVNDVSFDVQGLFLQLTWYFL